MFPRVLQQPKLQHSQSILTVVLTFIASALFSAKLSRVFTTELESKLSAFWSAKKSSTLSINELMVVSKFRGRSGKDSWEAFLAFMLLTATQSFTSDEVQSEDFWASTQLFTGVEDLLVAPFNQGKIPLPFLADFFP